VAQTSPKRSWSRRQREDGKIFDGDFYDFDEFFMGISIILCVFIRDFTDFYSFMIF